ncbi:extracellular solute-binding protein [Paenibacillus rhizophilus]|uniref:Extracellular solute-binding protein n=1 Tax=Paenibacillus rhizophilus TaxID=1850366 RepID=A0A3N9P627_9BACL|nr:extracellular solute-binding protein [Paenibacillus rhizophilus]RQW11229.1 extracellular solute-binding protein [Paenibacillus rhizophilus]
MKQIWSVVCTVIILGTLLSACSSSGNQSKTDQAANGDGSNKQKEVTIKVVEYKNLEGYKDIAREFEKQNPGVKVEFSYINSVDFDPTMKARYAAGDMPDIFNNWNVDVWKDFYEDLSDQPWVGDLFEGTKGFVTRDGKLLGMPYIIEGAGLVYNKELFEKAGITATPKTFTELKAIAQKLEDSGTQPFVNSYGEPLFQLGAHFFNNAMDRVDNPVQFIEDLRNGKAHLVGNPMFEQMLDVLRFSAEHGNHKDLTTDGNTQANDLVNGKAAMALQGNWIQDNVNKSNPGLKMGIMPYPFTDDINLNDKINMQIYSLAVYNKSPNKEIAKKFLNFLVTSDIGKKTLVEVFHQVPAMKTIKPTEQFVGPINMDLLSYLEQGKVVPVAFWDYFPIATDIGQVLQKFVANKTNSTQTLKEIETLFKNWR